MDKLYYQIGIIILNNFTIIKHFFNLLKVNVQYVLIFSLYVTLTEHTNNLTIQIKNSNFFFRFFLFVLLWPSEVQREDWDWEGYKDKWVNLLRNNNKINMFV